jgi:hypothetical protein
VLTEGLIVCLQHDEHDDDDDKDHNDNDNDNTNSIRIVLIPIVYELSQLRILI